MDSNSLKPHLNFRKIDIERARHKSGGGQPPRREQVSHVADLLVATLDVYEDFERMKDTAPKEFDPAIVFRVTVEGAVEVNQWRRSGLTLLSVEPDGAVVLFSEDELVEFNRRIALYKSP